MFLTSISRRAACFGAAITLGAATLFTPAPVAAQVTAFKQAVAEAAARDDAIAAFYRENNYQPIWTGGDADDRNRLAELMRVIQGAGSHGLPVSRYDPDGVMAMLRGVRSTRDRGLAEVAMTRLFLKYARDVRKLEPGNKGSAVVALRNRLMAMGYLGRSNTMVYDAAIKDAVQQFQVAHGLNDDGKAGAATMAQINVGVAQRLQSVMVALERERWFNTERGKRHILVNIPDFTAKVIDDGKVTFQTRSVVGARKSDQYTPEFSDVMEHMIVNPSWYVPRSIATKEYLPSMQRNPNAAGHLILTDRRGRGFGEVHVPQQIQHLPARHARQKPVQPRCARLQPWLRAFGAAV